MEEVKFDSGQSKNQQLNDEFQEYQEYVDGSAFTRLDQDLCNPPIFETVEPIVEEETVATPEP